MAPGRKPAAAPLAPRIKWWHLALAFLALSLGLEALNRMAGPGEVTYSELRSKVAAGEVARVDLGPTFVVAHLKAEAAAGGEAAKAPRLVRAVRVDDEGLLPALLAQGVAVVGVEPPPAWRTWLPWLIPLFLLFPLLGLGRGARAMGPFAPGAAHPRLYAERGIKVTFADVAGADEAKVELKEVLDFLKEPERFKKLGGKLPKGVLLVGPPGTGKTLLARAVAGEAQVPFFSINGPEFVELFVGVGAARVRDLFDQARKTAPCIIFIDELDALGKVRGPSGLAGNEEREQTLNQLLVELDGFDPGVGVVLMAATNRPEVLDPALLRAGRFDRHVAIDRPDRDGRLAILRVHARRMTLAPDADLEVVAGLTAGLVGADLANLLNEAALQAVRHDKDAVGRAELDEAVERARAGVSRRSRALGKDEKRRVAVHESGHTLCAFRLPGVDPVRKVSVLPRGLSGLGYTIQLPAEDHLLLTRTELLNRITVLLAGRVAERLMLGEVSTGAQDDLWRATLLARAMVRDFGMSDALGPLSLDAPGGPTQGPMEQSLGHRDEAEATMWQVDKEVRHILETQERHAEAVLVAELPALRRLADVLLERESLTAEDLEPLLGRAPKPVAPPGPEAAA